MDVLQGVSHDDHSEIEVSFATIENTTQDDPINTFYTDIEPDIHWNREIVKQLISVVYSHFEEFYDKTIKKKVLWKRIASDMRQLGIMCAADECDKKWRNLKKSYVTALKKQTQGDFSSKFLYFDQMHEFLGKEIDPLGLREQAINLQIKEKELTQNGQEEIQRTPFYEVVIDDKFEWTDSAMYSLMDIILEHKELFEINVDIDAVWESIAGKMNLTGYQVLQEQCQRKWINLANGFKHYQAEVESASSIPNWPYFSYVRNVINTLNVPVTQMDTTKNISTLKGSLSTTGSLKNKNNHKTTPLKRKRMTTISDKSDSEDEPPADPDEPNDPAATLTDALKFLEKNLKVEKRLRHLEARVEAVQKQKAAAKHSNNLLTSILSELQQINKDLEEKKRRSAGQERLKTQDIIEGSSFDETPIVDAEDYQQTLFNMSNFAKFHLLKNPKVEVLGDSEPDGITVFVE